MTTYIFAWVLVSVSNWYLIKYGWERRFGPMKKWDKWMFRGISLFGPCATPGAIWVYTSKGEENG